MATRLYLSTNAAPVTPPTADAGWQDTAGSSNLALVRAPDGTSLTTVSRAETNAATAYSVLLRRFVSDPLAAQTISGTVRALIRARESATAANMSGEITVKVISGDGSTIRGVLYAHPGHTTNVAEWTTTLSGRVFPRSTTLTPASLSSVDALDGDRLLVEIGYVAINTSTTSYTGEISVGAPTSGSDLSTVGETTANRGWLELSQDLVWQGDPAGDARVHPVARTNAPLQLRHGAGRAVASVVGRLAAALTFTTALAGVASAHPVARGTLTVVGGGTTVEAAGIARAHTHARLAAPLQLRYPAGRAVAHVRATGALTAPITATTQPLAGRARLTVAARGDLSLDQDLLAGLQVHPRLTGALTTTVALTGTARATAVARGGLAAVLPGTDQPAAGVSRLAPRARITAPLQLRAGAGRTAAHPIARGALTAPVTGGTVALAGRLRVHPWATGAITLELPVNTAAVAHVRARGALTTAVPLAGRLRASVIARGTATAIVAGTEVPLAGIARAHVRATGTATAPATAALAGVARVAVRARVALTVVPIGPVALAGRGRVHPAATGRLATTVPVRGVARVAPLATGRLAFGATRALQVSARVLARYHVAVAHDHRYPTQAAPAHRYGVLTEE